MSEPTGEWLVAELFRRFQGRRWDDAEELLAKDFVAEWPQSRERFSGRDRYLGMNRAYPGDWHIEVRSVEGRGDRVFSHVTLTLGEVREHMASIWAVREGRLAHELSFFGEEYEPPAWRSRWAERT